MNEQLNHQDISFENKQFPIIVIADDIRLARNIGGLFRIAEAFGIEKLYLSGSLENVSELKIKKAARSTQKTIKYQQIESSQALSQKVKKLKQNGYKIISLEITSNSQPIRDIANISFNKMCLIIGSEKEGVSQALLDCSDFSFHIPMYGQNTSMNVSTATAIALYEITNQLRSKTKE